MYWNGDPVLLLNVTLALQWNKRNTPAGGKIEQRPHHRVQRRRLVVVGVCCAQHPVQSRYADGGAQAQVRRIFRNIAIEVGDANPASQRQPRTRLELILKKSRLKVALGENALPKLVARAVIGDNREKSIVLLSKGVDACASVISLVQGGKRNLSSFVIRRALVGGDWNVLRATFERGAIEVIEGRHDQHETGRV